MIIIVQNTFEQQLIGFLHELLNCSIVTATEITANTSAYKGFNALAVSRVRKTPPGRSLSPSNRQVTHSSHSKPCLCQQHRDWYKESRLSAKTKTFIYCQNRTQNFLKTKT